MEARADAIAADMATVFENAPDGFFDKTVGMRMRKEIYSMGDSRDINVSIEKFPGRPGVVAIVAFAGENQDGVASIGGAKNAQGGGAANFFDDGGFGDAGGPSGLFPVAHLFDGKDGDVAHGCSV